MEKGLRKVTKQCSQCRTVMNTDAPYCDACGFPFSKPEVPSMPLDLKVFISALTMIAVTIILIGLLRTL